MCYSIRTTSKTRRMTRRNEGVDEWLTDLIDPLVRDGRVVRRHALRDCVGLLEWERRNIR